MKKVIILLPVLLAGITGIVAQEYEYVPLVREGVKWECGYAHTSGYWPDANRVDYYTIELKGDTVINGQSYKNCLTLFVGMDNTCSDSTCIGYMREDLVAKRVYFLPNNNYIGKRSGCDDISWWFEEVVLYDFADITQSRIYTDNNFTPDIVEDYVDVSGIKSKRYTVVDPTNSENKFTIIEGVGCCGDYPVYPGYYTHGDLLVFFVTSWPSGDGAFPIFYRLKDAEGNVLYDAVSNEYDPIQAEGKRWKCGMLVEYEDNPNLNHVTPFTIELKGDTTIGHYCYKNVLLFPDGEQAEVSDRTVCGYLAEDVINRECWFMPNDNFIPDNEDISRHTLPSATSGMIGKNIYPIYAMESWISDYGYSDIVIDNEKVQFGGYNRFHVKVSCDAGNFSCIEGVGTCGDFSPSINTVAEQSHYGDLLDPMPSMSFTDGVRYIPLFYHLEDAEGNIIYDAPNDPTDTGGAVTVGGVSTNAVETGRYDIHGRRIAKPVPGINIIRMSDGSVRKELRDKK